ncbi:hypothetical protein D5018_00860 [Parashewanella curva]|uniref:Uncharacterized protein n=1 Tax=Parashewanella curva TaxID=2338552 RepID=A0A3L8Q2F3_9GAMM|nr:hypothetical protein [Parashewanella curva]RLV61700.1 hypothetical protein D5018_00860 [Parashewanella curva]
MKNKNNERVIHWEKWTALGTVLMAVCAIVTSLWQGHLLKRHNELSIYPHLALEVNTDPLPKGRMALSMYINNQGLGPANVTHVDILWGEKKLNHTADIWKQIKSKNFNKDCRRGSGDINRFYKVEDRQMVIKTVDCPLSAEQMWELMDNIRFKVTYESLYGEAFVQEWAF